MDPESGELRKQGLKVKLQEQPLQILQVLLEQPGKVVAREDLQRRIWPDHTFVDFDHGLYNAIKKLREALGDSAESPRYIETLSRRGYRFIGVVNGNGGAPLAAAEMRSKAATVETRTSRPLAVGVALALGAATLLIALLGFVPNKFWQRLSGKGTIPQIRSIAVLPLQNLSADPAQEYFSEGMTDALITDLAQIGSLKVISRTSTMNYKKTDKTLPEIARELNVDGIVEGTVQRFGDRVRITAQLIHGSSDKHLWANSYERDMRDVFALEREVTEDIARQVQSRLATGNQAPVPQSRSVKPDVLEAYLQGNYYLSKWGSGSADDGRKRAQDYFQHAINADPNFAPAYVGMADAHGGLMRGSSQDLAVAEASAKKAVELDPTYSDAHVTLGWIKFHHFWDWAGAEREFRTSIALNPNSAGGHRTLCALLVDLGRAEEALRECQIAQELDPNHDQLSDVLYFRREYDRAIELQLRWINRYPDDGVERYELYHCYALKGMHGEAVQELERTLALFGFTESSAHIHAGFARSGYEGAMRAWAREIEHLDSMKKGFLPLSAAQVYAALGDKDRAFYWLEQAYQRRDLVSIDDGLIDIKADPMLDPLRSDPRYKDLLRRVGLPP